MKLILFEEKGDKGLTKPDGTTSGKVFLAPTLPRVNEKKNLPGFACPERSRREDLAGLLF